MKKQWFVSLPAMLLLMAFLTTSGTVAQNKDLRDFEKTNDRFTEWFNSGNLDAVASLYMDEVWMVPDNFSALNSRQDVKAYYKALFDRGFRFTEIVPVKTVADHQVVIESGTWKAVINDQVTLSGTYLSQWKFSNGSWLIESEMTNTDVMQ